MRLLKLNTALLLCGSAATLTAPTDESGTANCHCDPLTDVSQFTTCEVKSPAPLPPPPLRLASPLPSSSASAN